MLECNNLSLGYDRMPILRDVSLSFPAGEVTALLGPNGCGKSTLLKGFCGLSKRFSGSLLVDGQPIESLSPAAVARRVAYLPQTRRIPDMTVEQLVLHGRFPHLTYPRRYSRKDQAIARDAMARMGLADLAQTPLAKLSGGTRQKAYIAMALAQDTGTVLLDEPNTHLDIAHQLALMGLCRDLANQGKAVVLVLHDLNLALTHSDRAAVLHRGTLAAWGTPEEIYRSDVLQNAFGVEVFRSPTPHGFHYGCRLPGKE